MDQYQINQYCAKIFTLSAQGDRSSRPSTGAPSREISVQNLSNPALGSPTKVGWRRQIQNQITKWTSLPLLENCCGKLGRLRKYNQDLLVRSLNLSTTLAKICSGNLDLLSHFCQGRVAKTVTQRSKWWPANLDNYAAGIDKNQPRGSWKLCGNSQICCKLTTKVFHNHRAMIQPLMSFSSIPKNFMTTWCKMILVHK